MSREFFFDSTTDTFRLSVDEEEIGESFSSDYLQARIATMASLVVPLGTPIKIIANYSLDVRPVKIHGYSIGNWPGNGDFVVATLTRGGVAVAEQRLSNTELSGGDKKVAKINIELKNLEPGYYDFNIKAFCRTPVRAEICSTTMGIPICDSEIANRPAFAEVDVFLGTDHVYDFSLTGERGWKTRMYPIQVQ